jgi:hypothetical protein
MILEHQSATPNIQLVRGLTSSSTDFNWRILNDNAFKIQNKTSTNAYADRFVISSVGNVGIGTAPSAVATTKLDILGDVKITGNIALSGAINPTATLIINHNITLRNPAVSSLNEIRIYNSGPFSAIDFYLKTGTEPWLGQIYFTPTAVFYEHTKAQPIAVRISNFSGTISRRWDYKPDGTCTNALNATTWSTTSDHRIKENIKKANLNICYNNVKNINVYRYNYIKGFKNNLPDNTQLGFIAQQVKQHFPKSVLRDKTRLEDNREIPDLSSVSVDQINFTLFGTVKQLIKLVEKQSKRIKKLEEMLNIIDDDEVDNDADEPYERIVCDEVDIDTILPTEPKGV